MLDIFIAERDSATRQLNRTKIGQVPEESGEYDAIDGRKLILDFSRAGGSKNRIVSVGIEGEAKKPVSLSRKTGMGSNTLGKNRWIQIEPSDRITL